MTDTARTGASRAAAITERFGRIDAILDARPLRSTRVRIITGLALALGPVGMVATLAFYQSQPDGALLFFFATALVTLISGLSLMGWRTRIQRWRSRFDGRPGPNGQFTFRLTDPVDMTLRTHASTTMFTRLSLRWPSFEGVTVGADEPALDDLGTGMAGSDLQRTLLGRVLRQHLAPWRSRVTVVLEDGAVRIGVVLGRTDAFRPTLRPIVDALDGAAQALERPEDSLALLADAEDAPLDAARAVSLLATHDDRRADRCVEAAADPRHRAVLMAGRHGVVDESLSRADQQAAIRGALGVAGPGRQGILATLSAGSDLSVRMTLADRCLALNLDDHVLQDAIENTVQALVTDGSPAALDWLRAHGRSRDADALADRLRDQLGGQLAVSPTAAAGGLTDTTSNP